MLWSCLTTREVGSLYKIEQILNDVCYLGLLQDELCTTLIDFDFDLRSHFSVRQCICL
jgi:hypothetical protein